MESGGTPFVWPDQRELGRDAAVEPGGDVVVYSWNIKQGRVACECPVAIPCVPEGFEGDSRRDGGRSHSQTRTLPAMELHHPAHRSLGIG